ncbi:MAG TPA: hypothetical protein VIY69_15775, partial [Candidatus Acidoferrales bacterium]
MALKFFLRRCPFNPLWRKVGIADYGCDVGETAHEKEILVMEDPLERCNETLREVEAKLQSDITSLPSV